MMKVLAAIFALLFATSAQAATTITFLGSNLVEYQVKLGTVFGSFNDLQSILEDQLWWGSASKPSVVSASYIGTGIGTDFGYPNTTWTSTGVSSIAAASLVAYRASGYLSYNGIPQDTIATFYLTPAGSRTQTVSRTDQFYFAVAEEITILEPIPLPASGMMLLTGVGLLGLRRFKRTL